MSEYRSVRRWSEIAWEKYGVVRSSAEMIGGGIGGNMVHDSCLQSGKNHQSGVASQTQPVSSASMAMPILKEYNL